MKFRLFLKLTFVMALIGVLVFVGCKKKLDHDNQATMNNVSSVTAAIQLVYFYKILFI